MLCEPKKRIGFLGACFFIGVIISSTILPLGILSDYFGRKWVFVGTILLILIAQIGFLEAKNLDELYLCMFVSGMSYPGRIIVAQNYVNEFQEESVANQIVSLSNFCLGLTYFLTAIYF